MGRDAPGCRGRSRARRPARAHRTSPPLRRGAHDRGLGGVVLGMTRARRAGLAALALGLAAAAVLHGRLIVPPVYDGIVVPPEPYRWESPPPNLQAGNKPPLSGDATLPVLNGQVAGGGVQTGDSQVVIYFGRSTFKARAGAQPAVASDGGRNSRQRLPHRLRGATRGRAGDAGLQLPPDIALPAGRLPGDPLQRRQRLAGP